MTVWNENAVGGHKCLEKMGIASAIRVLKVLCSEALYPFNI